MIGLYRVTGKSMEPSFSEDDYVLTRNVRPFVGDVVVLRHPWTKRRIIKRITSVDHGAYLVEGDNKNFSTDSRQFGAVSVKDVVGTVWKKF